MSLETMSHLFIDLEKQYNNNLKESYINFFSTLLDKYIYIKDVENRYLCQHLGVKGYDIRKKELLRKNSFLAEVIEKFHDPRNQALLQNIDELYIIGEKLKFMPPEFKKLTGLDRLSLSQNELKELDVSHNPNLTHLYLGTNQLETIDLSNNPALVNIEVSFNELSEIDLTKNINLTRITLTSNQLTKINLLKNTALRWLFLEKNPLKEIDLSKDIQLQRYLLPEGASLRT